MKPKYLNSKDYMKEYHNNGGNMTYNGHYMQRE